MRILQITHQYPPDFTGGVELYTQSLANQLVELGHQVAIFTRRNEEGDGMTPLQQDDVPYPHVYSVHHGNMSDAKRFTVTYGDSVITRHFTRLLEHFQPDVVHIQHLMGMPHQIVEEIRRRGIPYVSSLHDYWSFCSNANLLTNYSNERCAGPKAHLNCTRCFIARATAEPQMRAIKPLLAGASPLIWGGLTYRRHLTNQILMGAGAIVVSSQFVRNWYSKQGIPAKRIRVLPIGIEKEEQLTHSPYTISVNGSIGGTHNAGPIRFLYIGGVARIKGVHTVVEAFASLPASVKAQAELWIVGDTNHDPDYVARLQAYDQQSITFFGRQPREVVRQKMNESHVVLVPSLCDETFNLVAHEGILADRPIFVADVGALTDLVRDGENGRLLPPGDIAAWQTAMEAVVVDPPQLLGLQPTQSSWLPRMVGQTEHAEEMLRVYREISE